MDNVSQLYTSYSFPKSFLQITESYPESVSTICSYQAGVNHKITPWLFQSKMVGYKLAKDAFPIDSLLMDSLSNHGMDNVPQHTLPQNTLQQETLPTTTLPQDTLQDSMDILPQNNLPLATISTVAFPISETPTFEYLPAEIRHMIIRHLIHSTNGYTNKILTRSHLSNKLQSYLTISRAFNFDVSEVLFSQTPIVLRTTDCLSWVTHRPWVEYAGANGDWLAIAKKFRRVALQIPIDSPRDPISTKEGATLSGMVESGALRQLEIYLTSSDMIELPRLAPAILASQPSCEQIIEAWTASMEAGCCPQELMAFTDAHSGQSDLPRGGLTGEQLDELRLETIRKVSSWNYDRLKLVLRILAHPRLRKSRLHVSAWAHSTMWCPYHAHALESGHEGCDFLAMRGLSPRSAAIHAAKLQTEKGTQSRSGSACAAYMDKFSRYHSLQMRTLPGKAGKNEYDRNWPGPGVNLLKGKDFMEIDVAAVLRDHALPDVPKSEACSSSRILDPR